MRHGPCRRARGRTCCRRDERERAVDISILCSSPTHPVNRWLNRWIDRWRSRHRIRLLRTTDELDGGALLFLVSCGEVLDVRARKQFRHVLVLHASDLPRGRGWSPHIWSILDGAETVTVTMLEAAEKLDTGPIWAQRRVAIPKHALHDEIHQRIFDAEIALMDQALTMAWDPRPRPQPTDVEPTYHRLRTPSDSELDPHSTLASQFDMMRVADPDRYPAFFRLHGHIYKITLEKLDHDPGD